MLVVLVACIAFMIRYMSMPTANHGDVASPGSIVVTATWDPGNDDVDLWLMGPGEKTPVFYDNKAGATWDLLRDDLGDVGDPTPLNYENAYTRGEPPGEYTVNVLCYRCVEEMPVNVRVVVQETSPSGKMVSISTTDLKLVRNGQEATAIDFTVGPDGRVDRRTMNTVFRPVAEHRHGGGGL
jgi:hypothetical protein